MLSQQINLSLALDDQQIRDLQVIQKADGGCHGVCLEHLEHLEFLENEGLIRRIGSQGFSLTGVGVSVLVATDRSSENQSLDTRLQAAGMMSVAELLRGAPLDGFITHAGVHDLATFGQWLEMRRGEMVRLQARYDLGDKTMDDGMYEWITSHSAVLSEVHVNFKAVMVNASQEGSTMQKQI
ncbi:hypothetical protein [Pseudomonas sp. CFBP 13719]|uniref:hypothetical protein n=1 Tax=Pseudomonas sp. CFBP 13719 TaxID=2775303 RepID=UPI001784959E|nr:hypothetical protein [Pseudomonas sp. CFBP 13719]MBD8681631.1 hypothetical protein [Pseudomonas sp. CFBP 13719]